MPLKRVENWGGSSGALQVFLASRTKAPFAWGSNDCALFAADAVLAITGTDIAEDFRGKYSDEAGAFALIAGVTGGKTVGDAAAWCAQKAGLAELEHRLTAQRGDLVVIPDSGRLIAGVVHLSGRHIVSVGEDGLKRFPIMDVLRAWRV